MTTCLIFLIGFILGFLFHILWSFHYIENELLAGLFWVFYCCGHSGMVLLFIGRLYYSFVDSYLQISLKKFLILIAFYGFGITSYFITIFVYLGFGSIEILFFGGIYGIIDIILNITMIIMFVKRIKLLNMHTVIQENKEIYSHLIKKYTLLAWITTISTFSIIITAPIWNFVGWEYLRVMAALDGCINIICAYLSMGFTRLEYTKYCQKCEIFCFE